MDKIYDFIEYTDIAFSGWKNSNFICGNCYKEDHLTEHGQEKINEFPDKEFFEISSFPLGQNSLKENDAFHHRKGQEKALLDQLRDTKATLNIDYMSENDLLHFSFHKRYMIRELISWVKNEGVKDGQKLTVQDKVLIYLIRLRTNIPSKSLAFFYSVNVSSIQRSFNEIERAFSKFSHEFGSLYNPEAIISEHTSAYAKLAHGDDKIILSIDGTYLYRTVFIIISKN